MAPATASTIAAMSQTIAQVVRRVDAEDADVSTGLVRDEPQAHDHARDRRSRSRERRGHDDEDRRHVEQEEADREDGADDERRR